MRLSWAERACVGVKRRTGDIQERDHDADEHENREGFVGPVRRTSAIYLRLNNEKEVVLAHPWDRSAVKTSHELLRNLGHAAVCEQQKEERVARLDVGVSLLVALLLGH